MGNYNLELFGFAWMKGVHTFWLITVNTPYLGMAEGWTLFMFGEYEGKFYLKLFNKRIFGKRENY